MKRLNEEQKTEKFSLDEGAHLTTLANNFVELIVGMNNKLNRILDTTTPPDPDSVMYTVDEVARFLKVHPNTVRNFIKDGRIKIKNRTYPLRVPHSAIFDENNEVIMYKYNKNER